MGQTLMMGFRFFLIWLTLTLFPALVTQVFFGNFGALFVAGVVLFILILCLLFSDRWVVRFYKVDQGSPSGLEKSLGEVLRRRPYRVVPRFLVYSDPAPSALVVRSFGSKGVVLLSRGIVALLNEQELRVALDLALARVQQGGMAFQSLCLFLAMQSSRIPSGNWIKLVLEGRTLSQEKMNQLNPVSAVGFSLLFPWLRFLLKSGNADLGASFLGKEFVQQGAYQSMSRKLTQAFQLSGGENKGFLLIFPDRGKSSRAW